MIFFFYVSEIGFHIKYVVFSKYKYWSFSYLSLKSRSPKDYSSSHITCAIGRRMICQKLMRGVRLLFFAFIPRILAWQANKQKKKKTTKSHKLALKKGPESLGTRISKKLEYGIVWLGPVSKHLAKNALCNPIAIPWHPPTIP